MLVWYSHDSLILINSPSKSKQHFLDSRAWIYYEDEKTVVAIWEKETHDPFSSRWVRRLEFDSATSLQTVKEAAETLVRLGLDTGN